MRELSDAQLVMAVARIGGLLLTGPIFGAALGYAVRCIDAPPPAAQRRGGETPLDALFGLDALTPSLVRAQVAVAQPIPFDAPPMPQVDAAASPRDVACLRGEAMARRG